MISSAFSPAFPKKNIRNDSVWTPAASLRKRSGCSPTRMPCLSASLPTRSCALLRMSPVSPVRFWYPEDFLPPGRSLPLPETTLHFPGKFCFLSALVTLPSSHVLLLHGPGLGLFYDHSNYLYSSFHLSYMIVYSFSM